MSSRWILRRVGAAVMVVGLAATACSPAASSPAAPASAPGNETAPSAPAESNAAPSTSPSEAAASVDAPTQTAAGTGTTFTLVLADGPRAGTWEVTATGELPVCQNDPARESWNATWLGPSPISLIDAQAANDRDPRFMFQFIDEPDELTFSPSGDVTFTADDRGDTATLQWVSTTNEGSYFDAQGNKTGDATMGLAELTIECGSVFRFS